MRRTTPSVILLLLLGVATILSATSGIAAFTQSGEAHSVFVQQQNWQLATPDLLVDARVHGEISEEQRLIYLAYALSDYDRLPAQFRGNEPWSGTLALNELQSVLAAPDGAITPATASGIQASLSGACSSSNEDLPNTYHSDYFHIEYGEIGGDLTINDYAASLDEAWRHEVREFGWAAPPVLIDNPPADSRYHVRIVAFGDPNLLGYVSTTGIHAGLVGDNPNTPWNDGDAYASCMTLSNDFSRFYVPAQSMLDATAAHELNHSIQYGYGALTGGNRPDPNFVEGGATWIIDEVFDDSNIGYRNIWPDFEKCMGQYSGKPYFYWMTFRGLTEPYGVGVAQSGEQIMQEFWENISRSETNTMLEALNTALVNKGSSLSDAFHNYAITLRFTKPCPEAAPYCFAEATSYVNSAGKIRNTGEVRSVGGEHRGQLEDNYAINYIELPNVGSYNIEFESVDGGGEFRVSVVADTGSELVVTSFPSLIRGVDPVGSLQYSPPAGTIKVVAVITNQRRTAPNPSFCTANLYSLRLKELDTTTTADMLVTQSDSADPVGAGEMLAYDITVTNAGPAKATAVGLRDTLPADNQLVSAPSYCAEQNGVLNCDLGEIPAGGQRELAVIIQVPLNPETVIWNLVELSAAEFDPSIGNNTHTEETRVVRQGYLPFIGSN